MQSQDEYNRIKQLTEIDLSKPDELVKKIKQAEELSAVSHAIGQLPRAGDRVVISGLTYSCKASGHKGGKFIVKLVLLDKE